MGKLDEDEHYQNFQRWWRQQVGDTRHDWVRPFERNYDFYEQPYAFSEYFIFRDTGVEPGGRGDAHARVAKGIDAHYSDRLQQFDYDAYERARKAVKDAGPDTSWTSREASQFLTAYFDKPITCVALARGCNISNGYPYLIFWWKHN